MKKINPIKSRQGYQYFSRKVVRGCTVESKETATEYLRTAKRFFADCKFNYRVIGVRLTLQEKNEKNGKPK